MGDRLNHEWTPAPSWAIDCIHGCGADLGQPESEQECPVRLRYALNEAREEIAVYTRMVDDLNASALALEAEIARLRDHEAAREESGNG